MTRWKHLLCAAVLLLGWLCMPLSQAGACGKRHSAPSANDGSKVVVGAARTQEYIPLLRGKRVALFSNQTGMVGDKHTLDILLENGIDVKFVLSPEHGFRGNADAGERVASSVDEKTGVDIVSLYDGKNGVPAGGRIDEIDIIVCDIQDVGLRYYTYYVSMIRLIDGCIAYGKEFMILDRPNPNGMYVDGPILDMKYKSGVGWLPIPVVHGMTLGELAGMAQGEGWLKDGRKLNGLTVIPCLHYTHQTRYRLPVAPSPNLKEMKAIYLYPSTCYFEATPVSLGRGTDKPFIIYGHPDMKDRDFSFTPRSVPGAKNPPLLDQLCHGEDLGSLKDEDIIQKGIDLSFVIDAYNALGKSEQFFSPFFEKLIGRGDIRGMIASGMSADEIKATWQQDVRDFKERRKPYLLYKE